MMVNALLNSLKSGIVKSCVANKKMTSKLSSLHLVKIWHVKGTQMHIHMLCGVALKIVSDLNIAFIVDHSTTNQGSQTPMAIFCGYYHSQKYIR